MGIPDNIILDMMYKGTTTLQDFNWDALSTTPLLYLISPDEIEYIKNLILSPRYSGNNKLKMEKIDEVMHARGFTRFAGGTNRLVYTHPAAPNAVFKVAIDSVGINDNPAEYRNQYFLKPYCCKVFECTPCGTIASFEKVDRITTFDEFYTIADDYYYILTKIILGKYVMEDIGIDYFMNVGIRRGCHPVILDFPYLFELDGRKLECGNILDDSTMCGGEIDYDYGFNKLVCKKCGRIYRARDLAKPPETGGILLRSKGGRQMTFELTRGKTVVASFDTTQECTHLPKKETKKSTELKVELVRTRVQKQPVEETKPLTSKEVKNTTIERKEEKKEEIKKQVVTRYIDIDATTAKKVDVENASNSKYDVGVELVRSSRVVETTNKVKEKKSVKENKVVEKVTPKVEEEVKPVTVERVIDLSLGKPSKESTKVNVDKDSKVDVEVEVSKPAKKETKTSTKSKKTKTTSKEDDIIKAVTEKVAAECAEDMDDESIRKNIEQLTLQAVASEVAKEKEQKFVQAVTFGDDDNGTEEEGVTTEDGSEVDIQNIVEEDDIDSRNDSSEVVLIVNKVPKLKDAEENIFYCVPKGKSKEVEGQVNINPEDIDNGKYDIYVKYDNELIKVSYNYDTETWDEEVEEEEVVEVKEEKSKSKKTSKAKETSTSDDDLIKALKSSSKKASLDDMDID